MGATIQHKRSATSGVIPSSGSIAQAELAVNLASRKLYSKDGSNAVFLLAGGVTPSLACGRLTLSSTDPAPTGDILSSAGTTLYYLPFGGNAITLYNTTLGAYELVTIPSAGWSIACSNFTRLDYNYDIFAYYNGSTVGLTSLEWISNTARGIPLYCQDGMYFWASGSSMSTRYLGTVRTALNSGHVEDSLARRFVWNQYNQLARRVYVNNCPSSYTNSTNAWRVANADSTNCVQVVVGNTGQWNYIAATCSTLVNDNGYYGTGIGLDATNSSIAELSYMVGGINLSAGTLLSFRTSTFAAVHHPTPIGYHVYNWLEYAVTGGSYTCYSGTGGPVITSTGIFGHVWC